MMRDEFFTGCAPRREKSMRVVHTNAKKRETNMSFMYVESAAPIMFTAKYMRLSHVRRILGVDACIGQPFTVYIRDNTALQGLVYSVCAGRPQPCVVRQLLHDIFGMKIDNKCIVKVHKTYVIAVTDGFFVRIEAVDC